MNLWQVTHQWLKLCGNKLDKDFCRQEIVSHPDYPALTSLTDFLDIGGFEYLAVKADESYIKDFNYPILIHISNVGQDSMLVINSPDDWETKKNDAKNWSGVVIAPETDGAWFNPQNETFYKRRQFRTLFALLLGITALILIVATAVRLTNPFMALFGIFSLTGLIISVFLLSTELGFQSKLVKQVCGAFSDGGCEKVLKSKYARGVFGVTPGDCSMLYFATQFTLFLLGTWLNLSFDILFLLSLIGVLIAAWSVYTQAFIIKEWCGLCLGIVACLIVQAVLTLAGIRPIDAINGIVSYVGVLTALGFILLPVKQMLKINSDNQLKLAELKKWKADGDLFRNLWEKEQAVDNSTWPDDLIIGSLNASFRFTVACNPYCAPCAAFHQELDELLERHPANVSIQLRMLCPFGISGDQVHAIAIKSILQKNKEVPGDSERTEMLSDWFHLMDLPAWSHKWKLTKQSDVEDDFNAHQQWIKEHDITSTPTVFFNGRKLPGRYTLADLEILFPQLRDLMQKEFEGIIEH